MHLTITQHLRTKRRFCIILFIFGTLNEVQEQTLYARQWKAARIKVDFFTALNRINWLIVENAVLFLDDPDYPRLFFFSFGSLFRPWLAFDVKRTWRRCLTSVEATALWSCLSFFFRASSLSFSRLCSSIFCCSHNWK